MRVNAHRTSFHFSRIEAIELILVALYQFLCLLIYAGEARFFINVIWVKVGHIVNVVC